MLAKFAGRVLGVGKWLLALVGVVFLAFDLFGGKPAEKPEAAAVPVAVEAAADACLCSAGAQCVGPKGGKFCVAADGKKRYIEQK